MARKPISAGGSTWTRLPGKAKRYVNEFGETISNRLFTSYRLVDRLGLQSVRGAKEAATKIFQAEPAKLTEGARKTATARSEREKLREAGEIPERFVKVVAKVRANGSRVPKMNRQDREDWRAWWAWARSQPGLKGFNLRKRYFPASASNRDKRGGGRRSFAGKYSKRKGR